MPLRNDAISWYKKKYGKVEFPIYISKFYKSEESWPKKSVWWPQIPIRQIENNSFVHILCEMVPGKNDFHHLKIPTAFLKEHLNKFHRLKDLITLYLSTDPKTLFIEERGKGRLDFKEFLVK